MPSEAPDIVVVGASAGGVEALSELVSGLHDLSHRAMFVVLHMSDVATSALPHILGARTEVPVSFAEDGAPLRAGEITVARPGAHLILTRESTRLGVGPRENGHRPAIDPLFRSAASVFGPVTGILLSGALDDGVAGLAAIKAANGRVYVQDPDEALHPWMPLNAMAQVSVDKALPIEELARVIEGAAPKEIADEVSIDGVARRDDEQAREDAMRGNGQGAPGGSSDPNRAPGPDRYSDGIDLSGMRRSHLRGGHRGRSDAQVPCRSRLRESKVSRSNDRSRSSPRCGRPSVRSDEKEALLHRLGEQARRAGHPRSASDFLDRAREMRMQADSVRAAARSVVVDGSAEPEDSESGRSA